MRILDKIALNRLIAIITSFIISILKIFSNKTNDKIIPDLPDLPDDKPFPWIRKKIKKVISNDK